MDLCTTAGTSQTGSSRYSCSYSDTKRARYICSIAIRRIPTLFNSPAKLLNDGLKGAYLSLVTSIITPAPSWLSVTGSRTVIGHIKNYDKFEPGFNIPGRKGQGARSALG